MMRKVVLLLLLAALPAQAQTMPMSGALGPQPVTTEASGTSWQPEETPMQGYMAMHGDSMLMLHGFADLVYDDQGGPRGAEKMFSPSMLMAMAQWPLGPGTVGARAMLSLDPAMGKGGYPLLLQTGETADGVTPLVDRQHPHDLFMELAATYSVPVGTGSVFGYAGLPGEPALGPPAFMHRASGEINPEAPLTHHWLDSTHVTFGVVTLGATTGRWKFDASVFNSREPDENRWNIETRKLDSASGRVTFNPAAAWSLQLSHGYLASPEALAPGVAVHRTTASVMHSAALGGGHWSTTLALGINREGGEDHPGALMESARESGANTIFGRIDWLRTDHLFEPPSPLAGREFAVGKLSLGAARRLWQGAGLAFSAGAVGSVYALPADVKPEYGSNPMSFMLFLRAAIAGEAT